jgi:hypothetical protein
MSLPSVGPIAGTKLNIAASINIAFISFPCRPTE